MRAAPRAAAKCTGPSLAIIRVADDRCLRMTRVFTDSTPPTHDEILNLIYFFVSEPELSCANDSRRLAGIAGAYNRSRDCRIAQRPGNRDLARRAAVTFPNLPQVFYQGQISRELWLVEIWTPAAPVVLGKLAARSRVMAPVSRPDAMGE